MNEKPRLFYGWRIVAVAFAGLFCSYTLNFGIGVYFTALGREFSERRGAPWEPFPVVATYLLVWGAMHLAVGPALDRFGPRRVLACGGLLMGLGLVLAGWATEPWHLYLSFSVLAGVGFAGCSPLAHAALIGRWFVRRRGAALGWGLAGVNAGQALGVTGVFLLIAAADWRAGFWATGGALIVLAALGWRVFADRPAQRGCAPDGEVPAETNVPPAVRHATPSGEPPAAAGTDPHPHPLSQRERGAAGTLGGVLRDRSFWLVSLAFATCGFSMFAIFMNLPLFACCLMPQEEASDATLRALFLIGAASFAGMVIGGRLSDAVGRRLPLSVCYGARAASFVAALAAEDAAGLYLFAGLFGFFSFASVPLTSAYLGDRFGPKLMGRALGVCWFIHQLGAGTGILLAGALRGRTGNFDALFWIAAAALAAAAVLAALIRERRPWRAAA